MKSDTFERVYVDVKAAFNASGNLIPLEIRWVDGKVYEIDKVTDVRRLQLESCGQGDAMKFGSWQAELPVL